MAAHFLHTTRGAAHSGASLAAARHIRAAVSATSRNARLIALIAGLLLNTSARPSDAQVVDTTSWGCNPGASVLAVARAGNTIYLGGNFRSIGPATGGGVPCDVADGAPVPHFPRVVGRVNTVIGDGRGGWFVGGQFTHVGGQPRSNLAHILPDGGVSAWAPNPDEKVWALLLANDVLYVGGDFHTIGGAHRDYLAALSTTAVAPLGWTCDTDNRVATLALQGSTLFLGGWFTSVAGQPRTYVAAVELQTGAPQSWHVDLDDQVKTLAIQDTTLFIGGYFSLVNGELRRCIAAVGIETGIVHEWNPALDRTPDWSADGGAHVNALLVDDGTLLVAGSFSVVGGQVRRGLARLDLASGAATAWSVSATYSRTVGAEFWSMLRSGDTLFVAGEFETLGGLAAADLAAVSATTGVRIEWDPRPNDYVFALAKQGRLLFLGGWFTSVGSWVPRHCLASIDAETGRVTDWDPNPDAYVKSLLVYGGRVYVGGYFSAVGGQFRDFIASLDPTTGEATSWNPGADWAVWTMAPLGDAIVAGGIFTWIGGQSQHGLAVLDTLTGQSMGWAPQVGGDVYSLALTDSVLYLGGDFRSVGGQPRSSLAAVDRYSGAVSPWNPGTDGIVQGVALLDGTIYVGGYFHGVGGLPRNFLAAVDRAGSVLPWSPDASAPNGDARIEVLATADSTVFAGGFFSGLSGESREYFAALDPATAAIRPSWPIPDGPVRAIAVSHGNVYLGGGFGRVGSWPVVGLAAIGQANGPSPPVPNELSLLQCAPNPVTSAAIVRYSLPADLKVSLAIFDLQGRTVSRVIPSTWQAAGRHEVSISTTSWPPGCYLYRLEAGGASVTRKMLVIR